jgi:beta-lactamase class D
MRCYLSCLSILFGLELLALAEPTVLPDRGAIFDEADVTGAFVVYDSRADQLLVYNLDRAQQRYHPASTFKVANALIALETGTVKGLDEVIPYGGGKEYFKSWEQDMNLKDAMKHSNVAVFHQVVKRIGLETMKQKLADFGYGNESPGKSIDERFWLTGSLMISALEQVDFLRRLTEGKLPVKKKATTQLYETLLHEKTETYTIHAKTGWAGPDDPQIGWWVGWVTRGEQVDPFALNIDIKRNVEARKRVAIGKACLRLLKVID